MRSVAAACLGQQRCQVRGRHGVWLLRAEQVQLLAGIRVGKHAQVSQQRAHMGLGEQGHGCRGAHGYVARGQAARKRLRVRVRPQQHREIGRTGAVACALGDLLCDALSLTVGRRE